VLGPHPDARIPGLSSDRAKCHKDGIFGADVVLVPLEDGDRAEALVRMGKAVIAIDLNPLSRTAKTATITIVDELTRALGQITRAAEDLRGVSMARLQRRTHDWHNRAALREIQRLIARRLASN
jgi:4-phosphopantoate--beta-alanine ligase